MRVTGTNASGSRQLTSAASYDVISAPAAIADPIPDPDGGPAKSQAPTIAGNAWVGETLAGTVGGWKDPTTEFLRRWVRCDADGGACTYIQQVATTDPETGPTYVVRADDLGYTLRLRVIADVNGDFDARRDRRPPAARGRGRHSAERSGYNKPVPAPPAAEGARHPAGEAEALTVLDRSPLAQPFSVTNRRSRSPRDRPRSARERRRGRRSIPPVRGGHGAHHDRSAAPGRKVGRKCVKPSRKNSKRKKCTRTVRAAP